MVDTTKESPKNTNTGYTTTGHTNTSSSLDADTPEGDLKPTQVVSKSLALVQESFRREESAILDEYYELLRFKSISSERGCEQQVRDCAGWIADYTKRLGFQTELWETSGHPVVFAEKRSPIAGAPTVLIYGHYDVQPVDPLELWDSPPFAPEMRDGIVYARGAVDDKGQVFYVLTALRLLLDNGIDALPNIKLLIEGEEEIGSPGLAKLLEQHQSVLKADHLLIVDLGLKEEDKPVVCLGARGIVTMTVNLEDSASDLHSGIFGGSVYNPIRALVEVLSSLRDSEGRVAVPGFYDRVVEMSEDERKLYGGSSSVVDYIKEFGVTPSGWEDGFTPFEASTIRPAVEINGIAGGYAADGFKTVIPSKALAKVSCRLVPNQLPHEISELVANYIKARCPESVKCEVTIHSGFGTAVRANPHSLTVAACRRAFAEIFGKPCQLSLEGGSIPITAALVQASGAELALIGMQLPSDCIHAPNECFSWKRFVMGVHVITRILELLQPSE